VVISRASLSLLCLLAFACSDAPAPICGDGVVTAPETCDDGNTDDGDACKSNCTPNVCGDGIAHVGVEACDDGNADDGDACKSNCTLNVCGDGVLNVGVEACDDGNDVDTDVCKSDCTPNVCGDGAVHAGVEACDDGNEDPTDGCEACAVRRCDDAPWVPGPRGVKERGLAADFTLPTTRGPWNLRERWTGCDNLVFAIDDPENSRASWFFDTPLDHLIEISPPNVHYFFITADPLYQRVISERALDARFVLQRLEPAARREWEHRLHFVDRPVGELTGWIAAVLRLRRPVFAIDRRRRLHGSLGTFPDPQEFSRAPLAAQLRYFDFELEREARLAADPPARTITVLDQARFDYSPDPDTVDLTLPPAAEMAEFGRMEIDLEASCYDEDELHCPPWPQTVSLWRCGPPSASCGDGVLDPTIGERCDDGNQLDGDECSRYCELRGESARRCPAPVELARWVLPDRRIGRWVSDATPMLAWLSEGGPQRLHFRINVNPTARFVGLKLRLHRVADDALRPFAALAVPWPGGSFDAEYNARQPRFDFEVPAGTRRVELVSLLTGHGRGSDQTACAELCNHTHHFSVDGGPELVHAHPRAGEPRGCEPRVAEGLVPNQAGEWQRQRAGWCQGLEVTPSVLDLTDRLSATASHSLDYRALFGGRPYAPRTPGGSSPRSIQLQSHLVFWR
jgi:cysteine-rich repeat protein